MADKLTPMQQAAFHAKRGEFEKARAILRKIDSPAAQKALERVEEMEAEALFSGAASSAMQPGRSYTENTPQSFTVKLFITILLLFFAVLGIVVLPVFGLLCAVSGIVALSIFGPEAKQAQEASSRRIPGAKELIFLNRVIWGILFIYLVILILQAVLLYFAI